MQKRKRGMGWEGLLHAAKYKPFNDTSFINIYISPNKQTNMLSSVNSRAIDS
uniref:Uncharacterized protein n=1 Tax=Lepeophtheirus salmonis TaxID=72036 RepID=A0A0K2USU1_LEPSM